MKPYITHVAAKERLQLKCVQCGHEFVIPAHISGVKCPTCPNRAPVGLGHLEGYFQGMCGACNKVWVEYPYGICAACSAYVGE